MKRKETETNEDVPKPDYTADVPAENLAVRFPFKTGSPGRSFWSFRHKRLGAEGWEEHKENPRLHQDWSHRVLFYQNYAVPYYPSPPSSAHGHIHLLALLRPHSEQIQTTYQWKTHPCKWANSSAKGSKNPRSGVREWKVNPHCHYWELQFLRLLQTSPATYPREVSEEGNPREEFKAVFSLVLLQVFFTTQSQVPRFLAACNYYEHWQN